MSSSGEDASVNAITVRIGVAGRVGRKRGQRKGDEIAVEIGFAVKQVSVSVC